MNVLHPSSRPRTTFACIAALGALGALGLGACGDDDDDGRTATDTRDASDVADTDDARDDTTEDVTDTDDARDTRDDTTEDVADTDDARDTRDDTRDDATEDVADADDADDTGDDADTSDTGDVVTPPPGARLTFVPIANPVDITPEGTKVLLWNNAAAIGEAWSYDVATSDTRLETVVGPAFRDFPTGVSSGFDISALWEEPVKAGLWSPAGGWKDLGTLFDGCGLDPADPKLGDVAGAWDVSADGRVVVGLLWSGCRTEAFRWTEADGFATLATPVGGAAEHSNRATVIADDGSVAAGFVQTPIVDRHPARWSADGAGELLAGGDTFPSDAPGEVLAISADGRTLAGTWNQEGFVWSEAGGLVVIGRFAEMLPGEPVYANAIGFNGAYVFGGAGGGPFGGIQSAFVWTPTRGLRRLQDIVAANGLVVPAGTMLTNVLAASDDGGVVVGTALDERFFQQTFVLELETSAYR